MHITAVANRRTCLSISTRRLTIGLTKQPGLTCATNLISERSHRPSLVESCPLAPAFKWSAGLRLRWDPFSDGSHAGSRRARMRLPERGVRSLDVVGLGRHELIGPQRFGPPQAEDAARGRRIGPRSHARRRLTQRARRTGWTEASERPCRRLRLRPEQSCRAGNGPPRRGEQAAQPALGCLVCGQPGVHDRPHSRRHFAMIDEARAPTKTVHQNSINAPNPRRTVNNRLLGVGYRRLMESVSLRPH